MNSQKKNSKSQEKKPVSEKDLAQKIADLQAELESVKESQMRSLADLENFRRRESENRKNWGDLAVADFLRIFLPSFLELSLGAEHADDEGIKKVIEKFFGGLRSAGLQKISPDPGSALDPDQHEVVMVAEGEAGTIVQVFEPGWQLNEKVLVPAKVSAAESL